jgi:hypothetical protein
MKFASWSPLWAENGSEGGGEDLDSFEGWRALCGGREGQDITSG